MEHFQGKPYARSSHNLNNITKYNLQLLMKLEIKSEISNMWKLNKIIQMSIHNNNVTYTNNNREPKRSHKKN